MTEYKYMVGFEPHQREITVQVTARLKYLPNVPCGVIKTETGHIVLRAYNHYLLTLTPSWVIISEGVNHSYCGQIISAFLREYVPHAKYKDIKKQLKQRSTIYIGERELATL